MPWTGSAPNQTFTRTDGTRTGDTVWQDADAAGVDIVADDHDTHDEDIADGLNLALLKNGGNTATADIPMGGFTLTGLGAGAVAGESVRFEQLASLLGAVNLQLVTGTGTYTPTSGTTRVLVIATGGGGGGGGSDTDGGNHVGAGGGGGAGATAIALWDTAELGADAAVTIGAAGAAGSATNGTDGTAGGNTTVNPAGTAATLTANGGALGTGSGVAAADVESTAGGAGGTGSNGDLHLTGGAGTYGFGIREGTIDHLLAKGGDGGASFWSGGGAGGVAAGASGASVDTAGDAGSSYGSGGGGAASVDSTTGAAGGAGIIGVAVFLEFGT